MLGLEQALAMASTGPPSLAELNESVCRLEAAQVAPMPVPVVESPTEQLCRQLEELKLCMDKLKNQQQQRGQRQQRGGKHLSGALLLKFQLKNMLI